MPDSFSVYQEYCHRRGGSESKKKMLLSKNKTHSTYSEICMKMEYNLKRAFDIMHNFKKITEQQYVKEFQCTHVLI